VRQSTIDEIEQNSGTFTPKLNAKTRAMTRHRDSESYSGAESGGGGGGYQGHGAEVRAVAGGGGQSTIAERQQEWQRRRDEKTEEAKEAQERRELEGCTFKPTTTGGKARGGKQRRDSQAATLHQQYQQQQRQLQQQAGQHQHQERERERAGADEERGVAIAEKGAAWQRRRDERLEAARRAVQEQVRRIPFGVSI
jgi:hypothetical protein